MITRESLAPLRHPRFRYFLGARVLTLLGNAIAPMAVAFAVLDLTGSASALGLVLAARTIPEVVLLLFGGVIADRFRRDVVLVVSNILCFGTQGLAAALLLTGTANVWVIGGIEVLNGAASAFTFPALQGILPSLVKRSELQQANALNGAGRNIMIIGGGAAGGAIVGFAGPGWGLAVDAVTFGLAALLISRIRLSSRTTESEAPTSTSTWVDLREGWREFVSRRWLWVVVVAFGFINALMALAFHTLGRVVADETVGRVGWGFISSAMGVGLVLGTLLMLRWRPSRPLLVGMLGVLPAVPLLMFLGLSPSLAPLLVVAFINGIGSDLFTVGWETSLQEHVPQDKLSRVAAYDGLGSLVAMPLGQVVAGPLADAFGVREVIVACAVLVAVAVALTLADKSVRTLRRAPVDQVDQVDQVNMVG